MAKQTYHPTHTCPVHGGVTKGHFKTCRRAKQLGVKKNGKGGQKQKKRR